jgi:type IV pilus assembly protein PilX
MTNCQHRLMGVTPRSQCRRASQHGATLIIVLILLGVVALTAAATLRHASSNERVSNNFRMHVLAQQYAEAALRYCEAQLTQADGSRVATLKESNLVDFSASPAWRQRITWTGSGGTAASRTTVPEAFVFSSSSAFTPNQLPECVVEKQAMDGGSAYVVTARGFSSDYTADSRGFTLTGSVVWLQTLLMIQRSRVADPPSENNLSSGTVSDRTWRRILNPPIH